MTPNPTAWHKVGIMAKEPKVKVSFSIPQRQVDALEAAAGQHGSRSSVLGEVLDRAIAAGWLKPASAAKKGRA